MRAAVLRETGTPLSVEDVPEPGVAEGQSLVPDGREFNVVLASKVSSECLQLQRIGKQRARIQRSIDAKDLVVGVQLELLVVVESERRDEEGQEVPDIGFDRIRELLAPALALAGTGAIRSGKTAAEEGGPADGHGCRRNQRDEC